MDGWDNYFVAMAGAAVAFAGLVLVSVSINLERIIKQPGLVVRSAEPLIVLFALFVASSIVLIPDQRLRFYGYELVVLAIAFAIAIGGALQSQQRHARDLEESGKAPGNSYLFRVTLCTVTAVCLLAAGIAITFEHEKGVYFLIPATIVGFLLSFVEAWVLLIEIDR
jgi:modulator of FtsH protease